MLGGWPAAVLSSCHQRLRGPLLTPCWRRRRRWCPSAAAAAALTLTGHLLFHFVSCWELQGSLMALLAQVLLKI